MEYVAGEVGDLVWCGYAGIWEVVDKTIRKINDKDYCAYKLKLLCNSKFRFAKKRREINVTCCYKLTKEDMEETKQSLLTKVENVKQIIRMFK